MRDFKVLKQDFHICLDNKSGENVIRYLEEICNWYPSLNDSPDTNAVVGRDARRQVLATIKTFLKCSPDEIKKLSTR